MGSSSVNQTAAEVPRIAGSELTLGFDLWQLAVRRTGYSPLVYPAFAGFVAWLTPVAERRPTEVAAVVITTAIVAPLRIIQGRACQGCTADRFAWHRLVFRAGALVCGVAFSLLASLTLVDFGVTPGSLASLLILGGLVSGATASLAADALLARAFVVVTLLPPVVAARLSAHSIPGTVPLVIGCCAVFYLAVVQQVYVQSRELLLQTNALRVQHEQLVIEKARAEAAAVAKGAFVASISHELRTPLHGVAGMTELLQATALDATQRDYVTTLRSTSDALLGIINDVLEFSKLEAGKSELEVLPFDLHALPSDVCNLLRPQASARGIALDFEVEPEVPRWVEGDAGRIRQVLVNLVGNAVKFTHVGGVKLRIALGQDARVSFAVTDTGIGIAPEKRAEVFDAFSQADSSITRRYGGTGLGLAISTRLIRAMGSSIQLESELGRGSTFGFELALPSAAPPSASAEPLDVDLPVSLSVLVVDDNPVNLKVATRLLDRLGAVVATAVDGLQAVERVESGNFDVVLMDCMMPVMDGYSATRELRRRGHRVPIIALTANSEPADVERCLASGMDAHIAKPVKLATLASTLRSCLERSGVPQSAVVRVHPGPGGESLRRNG